jgi:hypothetical protein
MTSQPSHAIRRTAAAFEVCGPLPDVSFDDAADLVSHPESVAARTVAAVAVAVAT